MLLTPNYKLKKPEGTDVVDIDDINENADIIDSKLKELNDGKAPKNIATTSVNGLMSSADKKKLDGIAAGANAYVHPNAHPATMISQDATHRFATDTEKSNWNAKASTAIATTSANGLMSKEDKVKLNSVANNANNYVHPSSHPATMIITDSNNRFVTDAEKSIINGFEISKNTIGYARLPNGLLIQWGTISSTLESRFKNVDVVFPKMFTGGVKVFINCDWLSGTTSPANMQCNASSLSNSKFTATFKADESMFATSQFSAQWFAIGY